MPWLLLILFSLSIYAQDTKSLNGVLLEKGTRKPLQDVSVFILPYQLKAVTTENGRFSFAEVPAGECTIIINLTGYSKFEEKNDCGKVQNFNIYLEKKFQS